VYGWLGFTYYLEWGFRWSADPQTLERALALAQRAVALDPNNADSYAKQADVLNFAGRPEEALRAVEQAMRLNPRYPPWDLGSAQK